MKASSLLGFLISILIGVFVFFIGVEAKSEEIPNQVFKVYLNNQVLGIINSQDELLDLIDYKQQEVKAKYKVEKVYPPSGLEIKEEFTFNNNIKTAEEIYDLIQSKNPFTIKGYVITVKYPTDKVVNETGEVIKRDTRYINVLHKEDFEEAYETVIKAFVGSEKYNQFVEGNQPEITTVGSKIETIYWEENITIKESLIDVDSEILTNANDISKYLFFGTTKEQDSYIIKEGDDIETISANYNLNTDEFLVANPEFTSAKVLLTPGQKVNVGLIEPIVSIVAEVHLVEDIIEKYTTEYVDDPNSYYGTSKTIREGNNGVTRVTEKLLYRNGEILSVFIADKVSLTPVVNKVISRGTKTYGGGYTTYTNTGEWSWPTLNPFIITSRYAPRWGTFHRGIDISGTGFGSPIRAVQEGTVITNQYSSSWGYYVTIDHGNSYFTLYAHLARKALPAIGSKVKREQVIGYMGSTGFSTGTHLHLEVRKGNDWSSATYLDPCKSIFNC